MATVENNNSLYIGSGGIVATAHPQYAMMRKVWERCRSVMRGDCRKYLRNVGRNEACPKYGAERQEEYEEGALLYNFTRRTLDGMVGAQFHKKPTCELPAQLQYLKEDADGNGVGIEQQARDMCSENGEVGRGGLLTEMPNTEGMTRADQNNGLLNPKILPYSAESIINWRVERAGAINKLVMVVLYERYEYISEANEFEYEYGDQYRVLELDENGLYRQRLFRYNSDDNIDNVIIEPKANGQRLDYIPFDFFGAQNNDYTVDRPIIEAIADINIDHYRNAADLAELSHLLGQPTLFIAPGQNISADKWLQLNPDGVRMGSRSGHNIGNGGNAFLVQATRSVFILKIWKWTKNER